MAFATAEQVAIRLGRTLTVAEEAMVDLVLDQVTGMIVEVAGVPEEDLGHTYFQVLCIEKTLAVGSNPNQLAAVSERLGAYENSKTFRGGRNANPDLFLTEREENQIRRIASNVVSGSARPRTLLHDTSVTEDE